MFFGRKKELEILNALYNSPKSELIVLYGRRRIGKSTLIQEFLKNKGSSLEFEGLESGITSTQIKHFLYRLADQVNDPYLKNTTLKTWQDVLDLFTHKIILNPKRKKKLIIFFDEYQWMSVGQEKLTSLVKFFWDNYWKKNNVMLILCGSIASFMKGKVLRSNALYGRITQEMLLKALNPNECLLFFQNKRSKEEILKYLFLFGGIPKYLEMIDLKSSFNQNIGKLCFTSEGFFINECERIFYSQFKETDIYKRIVKLLSEQIYSFKEISNKLNVSAGGGLKRYLDNLENAGIILPYTVPQFVKRSKIKKYKLIDEYLIFYYKFIEPNLKILIKRNDANLFKQLCESKWESWLGFAFERFCIKNALYLADKMGFKDEVLDFSPYFQRNDHSFQIDLIYERADKVIVLCEIKYHNSKISKEIIPEIKRKIDLIKLPRGYAIEKALISLYGADEALKKSDFFHHSIALEDIL